MKWSVRKIRFSEGEIITLPDRALILHVTVSTTLCSEGNYDCFDIYYLEPVPAKDTKEGGQR